MHPTESVFAVAERESDPPVIVYEWPHLEVLAVLRGGAEEAFAAIAFR